MIDLDPSKIVFIDAEIELGGKKVLDIGAVKGNGRAFHSNSKEAFSGFLQGSEAVCGHNILKHDLKYLEKEIAACGAECFVDTLYLSPLLFPKKPYHRLLKDDKLVSDELNNPLNDAEKAQDLFYSEVDAFHLLPPRLQQIYGILLSAQDLFKGFFALIGYKNDAPNNVAALIREAFSGKICANAAIQKLASKYPVELAYALSLISVMKYDCSAPPWVLKNYPRVENILNFLRSRKCPSCIYCDESLDEKKALKRFFHYDDFRSYGGEPLQQNAAKAAVAGKSLLAVFPTGGGKSITFQLPALMAGENEKGLTVVISPLQSLMKDQTDNLERQHHITEAVTINSSLDPLERAKAFERVEDGSASLLYISPESLRSKSIERLLAGRNVVRFVIDEAHCFSSWGQDFRVDYLYIGDFILNLQKQKDMPQNIPVSCFTATAKQKVIEDIRKYFEYKLSLDLEVFQTGAARVNLNYHIFTEDSPEKKELKLRQLLGDHACPTIIYVSRTKRAEQIAEILVESGFPAKAYHGQMEKQTRTENQEAFMSGAVNIIVATTAFGMGVDKKDVGMVIHYDISDSLENYIQEAGRAGRDENIRADCYVLYNDDDLNKHFLLLNQTKLSQKEISQVWNALKKITKIRESASRSALEIAREAGWDDSVFDMETRVKTAVNALEQSGFVKRGQNMPRIFADSILVRNMEAARNKIDSSARFDDASRIQAVRIMANLFSAKSKARGKDEEGESRVDYISDRLGIVKEDVVRVIGLLRQERVLADAKDLVAYIEKSKSKKEKKIFSAAGKVEAFLLEYLEDEEKIYNLKEMNEALKAAYASSSIRDLTTILNYFAIKRMIKRKPTDNKNYVIIKPYAPLAELRPKTAQRREIAGMILDSLYAKAATLNEPDASGNQEVAVEFSVLELKEEWDGQLLSVKIEAEDIEDALYYLLKIGAVKIEGGFLVIYNAMRIERLERDANAKYKKEHYAKLDEYYRNKRQQIHIVGEYARRLISDYREALALVKDYFIMDYELFLARYFKGRRKEISRNMTAEKFGRLFGELSPVQLKIIEDKNAKRIVVAAGPGSGKTKLLTHKLASLYMTEDVKHEQMLMLTFSRASATEFKLRLRGLIGNAANFIQITTFHSYCFDLLGKVGNLEKSDQIIQQTIDRIKAEEVDLVRLTKTVLVIDEAQDMSRAEYELVKMLMKKNDDMRIIAVGDDDQNIYEFRGSSSKYFELLAQEPGAVKYELVDNYRSNANIVDFADKFAQMISRRFKTNPVTAVKTENGAISVCKLASNKIETPLVNAIMEIKPQGRTCIVTRTNEEALNIAGLLHQEGVTARQIQTNNDFTLYNLAELRAFVDEIDATDGYTVSDEHWQRAIAGLKRKYAGSCNLQGVLKLLNDFAQSHNKTKFRADLRQFIRESKLEDFISASGGTIFVSTIHQTKGREFDHVFLALSRFPKMDDETRRAIYVAVTRARQSLHIFYNGNFFDGINVENISRSVDETAYLEPSLICLQLSHKDVYLNHFIYCQREIGALISGQELSVRNIGCFWGDKAIVKFSAGFCARINELKAKGYTLERAYIKYVIFWKGKNQEKEAMIALPNVEFSKRKQ